MSRQGVGPCQSHGHSQAEGSAQHGLLLLQTYDMFYWMESEKLNFLIGLCEQLHQIVLENKAADQWVLHRQWWVEDPVRGVLVTWEDIIGCKPHELQSWAETDMQAVTQLFIQKARWEVWPPQCQVYHWPDQSELTAELIRKDDQGLSCHEYVLTLWVVLVPDGSVVIGIVGDILRRKECHVGLENLTLSTCWQSPHIYYSCQRVLTGHLFSPFSRPTVLKVLMNVGYMSISFSNCVGSMWKQKFWSISWCWEWKMWIPTYHIVIPYMVYTTTT